MFSTLGWVVITGVKTLLIIIHWIGSQVSAGVIFFYRLADVVDKMPLFVDLETGQVHPLFRRLLP